MTFDIPLRVLHSTLTTVIFVIIVTTHVSTVSAQATSYVSTGAAVGIAIAATFVLCLAIAVPVFIVCKRYWTRSKCDHPDFAENGFSNLGNNNGTLGHVNLMYEEESQHNPIMSGRRASYISEAEGESIIRLQATQRQDLMFKMAELDGQIVVTEDPAPNSKSARLGVRKGDKILGALISFQGGKVHPGDVADILSFIDDYHMELLFEHKGDIHTDLPPLSKLQPEKPTPIKRKSKLAPSPPPYDTDSVFLIKDRRRRHHLTPLNTTTQNSSVVNTNESFNEFEIDDTVPTPTYLQVQEKLAEESEVVEELILNQEHSRLCSSSGYVSSRTPTPLIKKLDIIQVRVSPAVTIPEMETGIANQRLDGLETLHTGKFGWTDLINRIQPVLSDGSLVLLNSSNNINVSHISNGRLEHQTNRILPQHPVNHSNSNQLILESNGFNNELGDKSKTHFTSSEKYSHSSRKLPSLPAIVIDTNSDEEADPVLQEYLDKARQLDSDSSHSGDEQEIQEEVVQKVAVPVQSQPPFRSDSRHSSQRESKTSPVLYDSDQQLQEDVSTISPRLATDSPLLDEKILAEIQKSAEKVWETDSTADENGMAEDYGSVHVASDDDVHSQISSTLEEMLANDQNLTGEQFELMMKRLADTDSETEA